MGIFFFLVLASGLVWLMRSAVKALQTSDTSSVLGASLAQPLRTGMIEPAWVWAQSAPRLEVVDDPDDGGWGYVWPSEAERLTPRAGTP